MLLKSQADMDLIPRKLQIQLYTRLWEVDRSFEIYGSILKKCFDQLQY